MKIAILGAAGRMGENLLRCAGEFEQCEIVAALSVGPSGDRFAREGGLRCADER